MYIYIYRDVFKYNTYVSLCDDVEGERRAARRIAILLPGQPRHAAKGRVEGEWDQTSV